MKKIPSKRVTISISNSVYTKLRLVQVNEIQKIQGSVSFSKVLNDELKKSIEKFR